MEVPEDGKGVEDGVLVVEVADVVELSQFAVFAVAAMPRWTSDRTSEVCIGTLERRARVMPILRGAMAKK